MCVQNLRCVRNPDTVPEHTCFTCVRSYSKDTRKHTSNARRGSGHTSPSRAEALP
jgi:hypothetical protein